jgi:hypothetical protein
MSQDERTYERMDQAKGRQGMMEIAQEIKAPTALKAMMEMREMMEMMEMMEMRVTRVMRVVKVMRVARELEGRRAGGQE